MRALSRTAATIVVALMLSVVLAVPAFAGQIISYSGETSATSPNRISFKLLKRDSGRRFLRGLSLHYTLTCEDATTIEWGIGIGWYQPGLRLGEAGEFSYKFDYAGDDAGADYFAVEGVIGFREASGTAEFVQARLTDDHTDS